MKKIFIIPLLLILLLTAGSNALAQGSLFIRLNDGTEKTTAISSVRKLTFTDNAMQVNTLTGEADVYEIAAVDRLHFGSPSSPLGVKEANAENEPASVYPNPAADMVRLKNIEGENLAVSIYDMRGALVLCTLLTSPEEEINVSTLSKGIYLLKVNNHTLKFGKL